VKETEIKRVAVIGAGLMGLGIGVEFARFGYQVSLYNTSQASSDNSRQRARQDLDLMVETELIPRAEARAAYQRLHFTTDLAEAASGADYVVESVLEVLSLKHQIFAKLDELCPPPAILATNTSGFLVTEIASVTKHPERILAAHYFQPPHFIPLVEVVGGKKTERWAIDRTVTILRGLRKKVVVIDKELTGFVGNRIQGAIGREIQSLVDQGVATPQMIDDIISFGFGRRMAYTGYFRRLDLIGLDFVYTSAKERGLPPWKPVAERVEHGELGMKTGKGFYEWSGDSTEKLHRRQNTELIRLMKQDMADGAI
jgi:3-hydroxybutyryl-CoA dehydrogenase